MATEEPDNGESWTPNQIVAYNVRRHRKVVGFTQEELARIMREVYGHRWTAFTVSDAELAVRGEPGRKFTVDEIVALSHIFHVSPMTLMLGPADVWVSFENRVVLNQTQYAFDVFLMPQHRDVVETEAHFRELYLSLFDDDMAEDYFEQYFALWAELLATTDQNPDRRAKRKDDDDGVD